MHERQAELTCRGCVRRMPVGGRGASTTCTRGTICCTMNLNRAAAWGMLGVGQCTCSRRPARASAPEPASVLHNKGKHSHTETIDGQCYLRLRRNNPPRLLQQAGAGSPVPSTVCWLACRLSLACPNRRRSPLQPGPIESPFPPPSSAPQTPNTARATSLALREVCRTG
jgi:hypothetical protein